MTPIDGDQIELDGLEIKRQSRRAFIKKSSLATVVTGSPLFLNGLISAAGTGSAKADPPTTGTTTTTTYHIKCVAPSLNSGSGTGSELVLQMTDGSGNPIGNQKRLKAMDPYSSIKSGDTFGTSVSYSSAARVRIGTCNSSGVESSYVEHKSPNSLFYAATLPDSHNPNIYQARTGDYPAVDHFTVSVDGNDFDIYLYTQEIDVDSGAPSVSTTVRSWVQVAAPSGGIVNGTSGSGVLLLYSEKIIDITLNSEPDGTGTTSSPPEE